MIANELRLVTISLKIGLTGGNYNCVVDQLIAQYILQWAHTIQIWKGHLVETIYLYRPMNADLSEYFRSMVELLHDDAEETTAMHNWSKKMPQAFVLLTTTGGSAEAVEQLEILYDAIKKE